MDGLSNTTPPLSSAGGVAPETIAGWIGIGSAGAALGFGLFTALIYCARICAGKDIVSDCIIGKSKLRLEVDTDGNGVIETDQKLEVNVNNKSVKVVPRSPRPRRNPLTVANLEPEANDAPQEETRG